MKHLLEHDTGVYLTNNEFKDAMLLAGYRPVNPDSLNWKYRIELTREINDNPSPFFRWARNFEADATPCGDFVRDMLCDFEFPVLAEHDVIARYLGRIGACSGAVEAFEVLWRGICGSGRLNRPWQKAVKAAGGHRTEIYLSRICRDARPLSADAGRTHRLCGGKSTGRKTEAPAAFQAQAPSAIGL